MFEWLATPRFSSDPMATTTHSSHTHTRRQKKRDMVVAALHECITQKPLSICRSPKSKTSVLALVSSSSSASATMSKVMDREKPTTYHVVSSGGGSLEVVPSMPRIEKRPYCCGYSSVSHERDSVLHIQRAYRVHFSVIDKTRSWSRGTKRSIRWYVWYRNVNLQLIMVNGKACRAKFLVGLGRYRSCTCMCFKFLWRCTSSCRDTLIALDLDHMGATCDCCGGMCTLCDHN